MSVTTSTPTSCRAMATPPMSNGFALNGPRKTRVSGDQIQAASPLKITNSAIVTRMIVSGEAR